MDLSTGLIVTLAATIVWREVSAQATVLKLRALIAEVQSSADAQSRNIAEARASIAETRAALAEARLDAVRADILRARAHMRRGLAPIVQRYGIDDPDLIAMSGILHQLTEGEDHGRN